MAEFLIGDRAVGDGHPCFIIAEAGINHNGSLDTAMRMIDAASAAGVDCVKFQTFKAAELASGRDDEYEYISQGRTKRESMRALFARHELDEESFSKLFNHARDRNMIALSTPSDAWSLDVLARLNAPAIKVGSDDLIYVQFLKAVARLGRPVILSSGMADETDIDRAIATLEESGCREYAILHCVSSYPAQASELNLRRILSMKSRYGIPVGFSDHSEGIVAAIASISFGASIIEKHFTLDRTMDGPDHWFSSDPKELAKLVNDIRTAEAAMGDGSIMPSKSEFAMRRLAWRSIVAARSMDAGTVLGPNDVAYRRPGSGLKPYELGKILGRRLRRAAVEGDQLRLEDLES